MLTAMSSVRAPKAAELVAAQLRRRIVSGGLKQGDVLPPEAVLVEEFGVSRPTLREGFRILEAERLILVRRGSRGGAHVLAPAGDVAAEQVGLLLQHRGAKLRDVYDAAALMEADVVRRLATSHTAADLAALEGALADLAAVVDDPAAYGAADVALHRTIATCGKNRTLDLCLEVVSLVLATASQERLRRNASAERPAMEHALRVYERLVELIRLHDADGAHRHWYRHMTAVAAYMAPDDAGVVELLS